jgi:hypothetical protein
MEGKVIEHIRNFIEWGGGTLGLDHQVVGLVAAVLHWRLSSWASQHPALGQLWFWA